MGGAFSLSSVQGRSQGSDSRHGRYAEGRVRYSIHIIPYNEMGSAKYHVRHGVQINEVQHKGRLNRREDRKSGPDGNLECLTHSTRNPISIHPQSTIKNWD